MDTEEFFINGESQGIAFYNINFGENICYFPGISISNKEKLRVNFGQHKFKYNYKDYKPIDIPLSTINGNFEITQQLLNILEYKVLKILSIKDFDKG